MMTVHVIPRKMQAKDTNLINNNLHIFFAMEGPGLGPGVYPYPSKGGTMGSFGFKHTNKNMPNVRVSKSKQVPALNRYSTITNMAA